MLRGWLRGKMIDKVKQGKRNRINGGIFERRVRKDLEEKGWIVDRVSNNVDLEENKCIVAKSNRFNMRSMGFPDFMAYDNDADSDRYFVTYVECKINGQLSKIEKEKARWYLKNKYCGEFLVASKSIVRGRIHITYTPIEL